ncbi:DUF4238 domain-containing protein [Bacillus solitudinis]|uniref:DUF4238 domain-containing protein n=1 Tax=Bacillus solitudinis TaxID=2014074 RepID=UPI000C239DE9|nr:DUF4238 domain-containing protein [Bacillus solitudinis]
MTNIVKNQHYVPQFMLRKFAKGKKHRIFVYDKFELKKFSSSVRSIASEEHFYNFDHIGDISLGQQFESQTNKRYEDKFASFINEFLPQLLHVNEYQINEDEKSIVAKFMAFQHIRTRKFREESIRVNTDAKNIYMDQSPVHPAFAHQLMYMDLELTDVYGKNASSYLDKITDTLLTNYDWILGKNNTSNYLYTSDSPFAMRESLQGVHNRKGVTGSVDYTILSDEIYFPLTPRFIFLLFEKNSLPRHFKKDQLNILGSNEVINLNKAQVRRAFRQVFSTDGNFETADNIEFETRKKLINEGLDPRILLTPQPKKNDV